MFKFTKLWGTIYPPLKPLTVSNRNIFRLAGYNYQVIIIVVEVFFLLLFLLLITVIFVERLTLTEGNYLLAKHKGLSRDSILCQLFKQASNRN
jgi:hypothetical protein